MKEPTYESVARAWKNARLPIVITCHESGRQCEKCSSVDGYWLTDDRAAVVLCQSCYEKI